MQTEPKNIKFKVQVPSISETIYDLPRQHHRFQFSPEAMTRTPQHQTGLVQVRSVALDPTLSPPGKETVGYADDLEVLFQRQGDRKIPSSFPFLSLLEVEDIFKNIYYKLRTIYLLPAHAPNLPSILFQLVEDFISREVKLIKNHHDVLETFPFRQESGHQWDCPIHLLGLWFCVQQLPRVILSQSNTQEYHNPARAKKIPAKHPSQMLSSGKIKDV